MSLVDKITDHISSDAYEEFLASIKTEADALVSNMDSAEDNLLSDESLNEWFSKPENQRLLTRLVQDVSKVIKDYSDYGCPGHDKRHLVKDLAAAYDFLQEEQIDDVRQMFLIPSLLHDAGRLIEEKFTGTSKGGVIGKDHAYLSYFLTKNLLEPYAKRIPQKIVDHMLYALIVHQKGTGKTFMAQAVQRADREQLVGVEAIARMFAFDTGQNSLFINQTKNDDVKWDLPLPGTDDDTHLFPHIEFYMRNLFPNIGSKGSERAEQLKAETAAFLLLSTPEDLHIQTFAPEMQEYEDIKFPDLSDVYHEKAKPQEQKTSRFPLLSRLYRIVTSLRQPLPNEMNTNHQENATPQSFGKFKGILAPETWEQAKILANQYKSRYDPSTYSDANVKMLLLEFIGSKGTYLSNDIRRNIISQIDTISDYEKRMLHLGLSFSRDLQKTHDLKDQAILEKFAQTRDWKGQLAKSALDIGFDSPNIKWAVRMRHKLDDAILRLRTASFPSLNLR